MLRLGDCNDRAGGDRLSRSYHGIDAMAGHPQESRPAAVDLPAPVRRDRVGGPCIRAAMSGYVAVAGRVPAVLGPFVQPPERNLRGQEGDVLPCLLRASRLSDGLQPEKAMRIVAMLRGMRMVEMAKASAAPVGRWRSEAWS